MLKIKKDKYLYATVKIDRKVIDFYICKVSEFDFNKHVKVFERKFNAYLESRVDISSSHNFFNSKTAFGAFYSASLKLGL